MVSLTIDGKAISVPAGVTILEAAQKLGIAIPTLCWLQKISPTGACRICAVEVEGVDRTMTACNTPVKEGIVVTTQSESLRALRKQIVELLLVNHPLDCPVCDAGGECDLQNICYDLDVERQSFVAEDVNHDVINEWPLIQQVPNRCVMCEKCVKVCHEVVGSSSLFVNEKGDAAFIDKHLDLCEFCGSCVSVCPTGTMISKPFKFRARPWELTKTASVCTYCPSHCQIEYNVKQGKVLRVTSKDGETVNDGNLCIGGFFGYDYINSDDRLTKPLLRDGGEQSPISWDQAFDALKGKFGQVKPEQVAGLASPRLTNEENYLFQRLFRAAIGSNNIDSEARFGALKAQSALKGSLGLQGGSNRLDRIGKSDAVLILGSDVTAEAPAVGWEVQKACAIGGGKLVVANMRRVKMAGLANNFLNYRPGSEAALANALARLVLDKGLADAAFLERYVANLDELKSHLAGIDLDQQAAKTGLTLEELGAAAELLGQAESVAVVFGSDVTGGSKGAEKTSAIANLAMICGALHGDIGGLFPVAAKGNTQGLLDMGVYPESLPGYQDYATAGAAFEKAYGALPKGGMDAYGILEGIEEGEIRFLYLAATNPLTYPDSGRWQKALEKVEFLVVQDILSGPLTRLAHLVLPGSAPAEKTGSVTALDNRISCLGKAIGPVGEAREDWDILAGLHARLDKQFDADSVLAEMKQLVPLYSEVCFPGVGRCQPCLKEPFAPADKSLNYVAVDAAAAVEGVTLVTGSDLAHFGTTSTRSAANLEITPEGYIEINSEDAAGLGIGDGGSIVVASSVGTIDGPARVSDNVPKGLLFAPVHFAELDVQSIIPAGENQVTVKVSKA